MPILPLESAIVRYPWGSRRLLAQWQSRPLPAAEPEAELWMGVHPGAPSSSGGRLLGEIIADDPVAVLGASVAARGGGLPFLFKILAVERPLSVQTHPDARQAAAGYEREEAAGIPLDAPQRSYRDRNHKPEIVCALDRFWALSGFRPYAEILELVSEAGLPEIAPECGRFAAGLDGAALKTFFVALMGLDGGRRDRLLSQLAAAADQRRDERPEYGWIREISQLYPGDPGVLNVLLLNLVELAPGEALYCGAGRLHCYLRGFGVELMSNSDNVLRAGLTAKHVDLRELTDVLTFAPQAAVVLRPEDSVYRTPCRDFRLSVVDLTGGGVYSAGTDHGFEILVAVTGRGTIRTSTPETMLEFGRGDAVAVTANTAGYEITGRMLAYKASVGAAGQE